MPLSTHQLIELAEAGRAVTALSKQLATSAVQYAALAQEGQITPAELADAITELFLGNDTVLQPFEYKFERVLLHYNKLRLRINANTARRVALYRARRAGQQASHRIRTASHSQLTEAELARVAQDDAEALQAEWDWTKGGQELGGMFDEQWPAPDE